MEESYSYRLVQVHGGQLWLVRQQCTRGWNIVSRMGWGILDFDEQDLAFYARGTLWMRAVHMSKDLASL